MSEAPSLATQIDFLIEEIQKDAQKDAQKAAERKSAANDMGYASGFSAGLRRAAYLLEKVRNHLEPPVDKVYEILRPVAGIVGVGISRDHVTVLVTQMSDLDWSALVSAEDALAEGCAGIEISVRALQDRPFPDWAVSWETILKLQVKENP